MNEDQIASVFRELRRSGHLNAVLRVHQDALISYRKELDRYLLADLLTDEAKRAAVYSLQGQMKTCQELLVTITTMAEDAKPRSPAPDSADS